MTILVGGGAHDAPQKSPSLAALDSPLYKGAKIGAAGDDALRRGDPCGRPQSVYFLPLFFTLYSRPRRAYCLQQRSFATRVLFLFMPTGR